MVPACDPWDGLFVSNYKSQMYPSVYMDQMLSQVSMGIQRQRYPSRYPPRWGLCRTGIYFLYPNCSSLSCTRCIHGYPLSRYPGVSIEVSTTASLFWINLPTRSIRASDPWISLAYLCIPIVHYCLLPDVSMGIQRYPWVSSRASLFWIHLPLRSHPSQWPLDRPAHLLLRNAGTAVSAKDGPTDLDYHEQDYGPIGDNENICEWWWCHKIYCEVHVLQEMDCFDFLISLSQCKPNINPPGSRMARNEWLTSYKSWF